MMETTTLDRPAAPPSPIPSSAPVAPHPIVAHCVVGGARTLHLPETYAMYKSNAIDALKAHGYDSHVFFVLKMETQSHGRDLDTPQDMAAYKTAIDHLTPRRVVWLDEMTKNFYPGADSQSLSFSLCRAQLSLTSLVDYRLWISGNGDLQRLDQGRGEKAFLYLFSW